jgi:hypothetical protein
MTSPLPVVPPFVKIVRPGTVECGRSNVSLYLSIKWDGSRLSISGVVGPTDSGNARGSCGQVIDSLLAIEKYAKGWDRASAVKLARLWRRWHLNDMRAGTPGQELILRMERSRRRSAGLSPLIGYDEACAYLASVDTLVDDGYKYGCGWLHEDVPADVLEWFAALPDTDKRPAWV